MAFREPWWLSATSPAGTGYVALPGTTTTTTTTILYHPPPRRFTPHLVLKMANRGYDVVVDVDTEGDLGHTDLQDDDLEFHSSSMLLQTLLLNLLLRHPFYTFTLPFL